jgi:predicted Zn-dependent peptidase
MQLVDKSLDSGARLLAATPFPSELVTVALTFHVGFAHEGRENLGISHMLEHLCFSDNSTQSFSEFRNAIDALGGRFNGYTSDTQTVYYIELLKEHWKQGLSLLGDIAFNPKITEESCKKERKVLWTEVGNFKQKWLAWFYEKGWWRDEWVRLTDIQWNQGMHCSKTFHCYDDITPTMLRQWHNTYYQTDNMAVIATGDLDINLLTDYVNQLFSCQSAGSVTINHPLPDQKPPPTKISSRIARPFWNQSGVTIGTWNDGLKHGEQAVADIANEYLRNKAFDLLRLKHGLAYGCWTRISRKRREGILTISAEVNRGDEERTAKLLNEVLDEVMVTPISDKELLGLRNKMLSNYARKNAHPSWYVRELAEQAFADDTIDMNDYPALVKKVSSDDIQGLLKRLHTNQHPIYIEEIPLLTVVATVWLIAGTVLALAGIILWLVLR